MFLILIKRFICCLQAKYFMRELYEQRAEKILRMCYSILSDSSCLEERASFEDFEAPVSKQKNDYDYVQDIGIWLKMFLKIPMVLSLDRISIKKLKSSSIIPIYESGEQGVREPEIIYHEKREEILKVLSSLSHREREVLVKMFYEEKNMSEIAREIGTTTSNVWEHKNNALKKLRHPLIKERLEGYYIK